MGSHQGEQSQPQAGVQGKGALNKVLNNAHGGGRIVAALALWDLSTSLPVHSHPTLLALSVCLQGQAP